MGLFSKGKMELKLEKYSFSPGETINGELSFSLKKPYPARGVKVRLLGTETVTKRRGDHTERKRITLCDVTIPLDGEREYSEGSYKFEIPVPADANDASRRPSGALGDALDAVSYMSGTRRQIEWEVIGFVDMKGFDLNKKQDIVVNQS